jgi:hypothetical protein
MPEWLKRIWIDPVGSKLIAAFILGGAGWLIAHYRNRSAPLWVLVLLIGLVLALAYALLRRSSTRGLRNEQLPTDVSALDPIRITHPRPGEVLADGQPVGRGYKFPIRGTLKSLPRDHEIWLLTKDASGQVWPQGFSAVVFDPQEGTWAGWIVGGSRLDVNIIAVVAPPTSKDFFSFFQKVVDLHGIKSASLLRVPVECVNQASVLARMPKP